MKKKDISIEKLISAASKSDKKAVKQALEKLEFALLMSYTEEELREMTDLPMYHLRVGHKVDGEDYVYTVLRWCGSEFIIYTNTGDSNGMIGGKGNTVDKDPAIVYLNKPRMVEKKIAIKKILGVV